MVEHERLAALSLETVARIVADSGWIIPRLAAASRGAPAPDFHGIDSRLRDMELAARDARRAMNRARESHTLNKESPHA